MLSLDSSGCCLSCFYYRETKSANSDVVHIVFASVVNPEASTGLFLIFSEFFRTVLSLILFLDLSRSVDRVEVGSQDLVFVAPGSVKMRGSGAVHAKPETRTRLFEVRFALHLKPRTSTELVEVYSQCTAPRAITVGHCGACAQHRRKEVAHGCVPRLKLGFSELFNQGRQWSVNTESRERQSLRRVAEAEQSIIRCWTISFCTHSVLDANCRSRISPTDSSLVLLVILCCPHNVSVPALAHVSRTASERHVAQADQSFGVRRYFSCTCTVLDTNCRSRLGEPVLSTRCFCPCLV